MSDVFDEVDRRLARQRRARFLSENGFAAVLAVGVMVVIGVMVLIAFRAEARFDQACRARGGTPVHERNAQEVCFSRAVVIHMDGR